MYVMERLLHHSAMLFLLLPENQLHWKFMSLNSGISHLGVYLLFYFLDVGLFEEKGYVR